MTRDQIREVFLAHGFTVKPGHDDLKPYVYEAAEALLALAAPEAAEPVATVHGVGWELDDAEVRVFGVPVRTWCRSFACTEPEREAGALADKINAAAKLAPTDSQAGRDAVEAFTDRQCLLLSFRLRRDVDDVQAAVDRFIEHGAKCAVEKCISEVRAALSITAGRTAE